MSMTNVEHTALAARYKAVQQAIPAHVALVAVSKTRSVEEIRALYDLGHRAFGENYIQELVEKQAQLPMDIEWHHIGHLQTNKVKLIVPFVHLVQGVDSVKLLDELDRRAGRAGRTVQVLLQVHIAQEETKHGFSGEELTALLDAPWRWPNLVPRGLMGMATNTAETKVVATEFAHLSALFKWAKANAANTFDTLSMGMSADAPLAIAAGSNLVRIGTAIFGDRSAR